MDRRRLSILATLVLFSGALALLFLNRQGHTPHMIWPYYAIQFMAGIARAFARPANQAMRTELVPRAVLANAATWNSSLFNTAMVLGPAIGGLLYGFGGSRIAYGTQTVLMLISMLALLLGVSPKPRKTQLTTGMWLSLKEGIAFVSKSQVILGALSLDLFAVLFGGAPALLPIFASDILKVGPEGLGILRAAPAVGSILTAVALTHLPPMKRAGGTLLWAVGVFGLCWIVFAYSHSFLLSLLILAISGAADSVSVVVRQTLVQLRTPPELMGRVSAVSQIFITSSNEVGAFESGLMAKLLGLIPSVVFGGLMTLGVVGFTSWKAPELRKLKRL
jgi:MFS family permease